MFRILLIMNVRNDKYFLVIQEYDRLNNKHISGEMLTQYCTENENISFFAHIEHDKDINDVGEQETRHHHLVIKLRNAVTKTRMISDVAKFLAVNVNVISSRVVKNFCLCVRYLIHADDEEKYQYKMTNIITNDYDEVYSIITKCVSIYDLEIDYLVNLVRECRTLTQVYQKLGMKQVKRYRAIISDLWKERML